MSRIKNFKKCIKKIPELEKYLSGNNELPISIPETNEILLSYFVKDENNKRSRGGFVQDIKNNGIRVLALQSSKGGISNHSVILVKNEYLTNEWSIFDSNSRKNLPFNIIYKNTKDKYVKMAKNKYMEISPATKSINIGSESKNPGFCGIFGVIFMIYFRHNCHKKEWVNNWYKILKHLQKDENGIDLAAEVQEIIAVNSNNSKIEKLINVLLTNEFSKLINTKKND